MQSFIHSARDLVSVGLMCQPDKFHTEVVGRYNVEANGVKFSRSAYGRIALIPIHDSLPSEISLMHLPHSLTRSECKQVLLTVELFQTTR